MSSILQTFKFCYAWQARVIVLVHAFGRFDYAGCEKVRLATYTTSDIHNVRRRSACPVPFYFSMIDQFLNLRPPGFLHATSETDVVQVVE